MGDGEGVPSVYTGHRHHFSGYASRLPILVPYPLEGTPVEITPPDLFAVNRLEVFQLRVQVVVHMLPMILPDHLCPHQVPRGRNVRPIVVIVRRHFSVS